MTRIGWRSLAGDAALAAGLAAVGVVTTAVLGWTSQSGDPVDGRGVVLVGATGLVLAVRRRWPLATLAAATVLTAGYLVLDYPYGLILVSFAVAVYTVARHRPLARSAPAALLALPVLLTHILFNSAALPGFAGLLPGSAWVVVPFAIGVTVRARQEVAARARAEVIRAHVDHERLRVAQEVHDIVGHGLAAIKMQADVALHVLPNRPEQAQQALDAISRTSGGALDELRATLAVVRGADPGRSPATSLGRVAELRDRMGEAGLRVDLSTTGEARSLPPAVDLAGYRVVQESLTNALRHGAGDHAAVALRYRPGAVDLTISNPAGPGDPSPGGTGLEGLRQRVLAVGGEFAAGPTAGGRFEVRASLPTGEGS